MLAFNQNWVKLFIAIMWLTQAMPVGNELVVNSAAGQEIGFAEEFALAENREQVLKQLVPGTEQYYFYHCLHFQNTQQLNQVDEMLKPWIKRFGYTSQVNQIRNRQALLKYSDDPQATLQYLQQQLNLNFNHQRVIPDTQRDLPSVFNSELISRDKLVAKALSRYQNSDGFTDDGLRLLATQNLNKTQLRHLLERLRYPDIPNLTDLIVRDLKERDSRGFGPMPIHQNLTLDQMKDLARKFPQVAQQTNYVNTYLRKLHPSEDVNWRADQLAHRQYLDRLWSYVSGLNETHNSLKACILYRKLELDLSEEKYDLELFKTYLQLPRSVGYINPVIIKNVRTRSHIVNLSQDFNQQTRLMPVFNDEPLVREYLAHFLVGANDTREFAPFIESNYLDRQFAITKILNGLGDREKWASELSPQEYQELVNRIDLDFVQTNPEYFSPDDAVELELYLKNVKTLIVKVFEINTQNYYRKHDSEIDTNINLDGLVPNFEETFSYQEAPALRIRRSFKFPQLKQRGVYVVDFIAGGKSSRALIRKGRLHIAGRTTAAGQLFTVLDEQGSVVTDADLWVAGRRYQRDEEGQVLVPFSTQPGRVNAIIMQDDFSCLQAFEHVAEQYQFKSAIVLDRELLTRSNKAKILLRPSLRIGSESPVPLSLLKRTKLVVTTRNQDDIPATKTFEDFVLSESKETLLEFVVPPRARSFELALTAEIENISRGTKETVRAAQSFVINEIDRSDVIQDVHLVPSESGYYLEFRGKTGEPRIKQGVRLNLQVAGFKDTVDAELQSDQNGRIELGKLGNVQLLKVSAAGGSSKAWYLPTEDQTTPFSINSLAGEQIVVAAPAGMDKVDRSHVALFELRRGTVVRDLFDSVSFENGLLSIDGLEAGDYLLRLNYFAATHRQSAKEIKLQVTQGKASANVLVGEYRQLENRTNQALQISAATANPKSIDVQLQNVNPFTRVHVFSTRYQPAFNAFGGFSVVQEIEPWSYRPSIRKSVYMEGRKIGDEYQYILERKYAKHYPGNMLERPSLLLNPWATKQTDNDSQNVNAGDEFGEAGNEADSGLARGGAGGSSETGNTDFANLDFLGDQALILANLIPDENGKLSIDRKKLGNVQHVRIVAVDATSTCQRTVNTELQPLKPRDSRLANVLDADGHFSQRKQIEILNQNQELLIEDIVSAKFQYYDDLGDVFRLLGTLNPNTELKKFEFILTWLDLEDEQKQELYSKHACHELNFYLMKKDPVFFNQVVTKYLQNKKDKTFLDHWLLNDNLDAYTQPWKYARLNVVERILLAQRLEGSAADIVRNINEMYRLSPTPRDRFDRFYDMSIANFSLDDNLGRQLNEKLMEESKALPSLSQFERVQSQLGGGGMGGRGRRSAGQSAAPAAPAGESGFGGELMEAESMDALAVDLDSKSKRRSKAFATKRSSDGIADKEAVMNKLGKVVDAQEKQSEVRFKDDARQSLSRREISLGLQVQQQQEMFFGRYDAERLSQLRKNSNSLYRRLNPTQEWMENNYYQLLPDQQTAELVTTNRFWRDYANHDGGDFLSPYFSESHRNFTEIMFALSVLDLPLKSPEQQQEFADNKMTFTAASPTIVLHQQVQPAMVERGNTTVLVSENFFQKNDRYRFEDGVRFDKFIADEFHAHTLYGGQVVITNPTSTPRAVDLLIQIPQGAVACSGSQDTKTIQLNLEAFSTKTYEYSFYFPTAGQFSHYPAHVSADEKILAIADAVNFAVTDRPAAVDKSSWEYVSQNGSDDEVIEFLNQNNILRLDLAKIAFRMQDKSFFQRAVDTIRERYAYNHVLWSYAVKHDVAEKIREFLTHADQIATNVGPHFQSELLTVDPVERNWYQHREYWPLVNARAHKLGPSRKILNPDFFAQYQRLMNALAYRQSLGDDEHLVVTYYMLLQDRIESALRHFDQVSEVSLASKIQYAYCEAYLDMYLEKPDDAAATAARWADYPVDHWRNRFKNILAQVEEIRGGETAVVDQEQQTQKQTELASKAESFDLVVESGTIKINHQNLTEVKVNFYEMDIELLFSRSPFAQDELDGFSMIRPNFTQQVLLPIDESGKGAHELQLPDELKNKNILVEVVAGDQAKSEPYFAHSLDLQMVENYGQLQVIDGTSRKPIPKTYVKVYAKMGDGSVRFHKDGYTDLRGRFDYVSQSNNSLDGIQKLSVLVLSESQGAMIRQSNPPKE